MRYPKEVTLAKKTLTEHKAENIVIIDVRERTPFSDFVVLASATNIRMVGALAEEVAEAFTKAKMDVKKVEGHPISGWVIVDAGSVVVHVLSLTKRAELDLDTLLSNPHQK
jgi:ribosome-associated protein